MTAPVSSAGLTALKQRLSSLDQAVKAEVTEALGEIAAEVLANAGRALGGVGQADRHGRHQPSAPGEPPADPSGALAASLAATLDRSESRVTITAASRYAIFLEYGTRTMAARPFLRPAVAATSDDARGRLRAALARAAQTLGGAP